MAGMVLDKRSKLFLTLAAVFVTSLVVGDLIGGKLIEGSVLGFAFTLTVGMIPFPVTFLLTDLINEFYGKRAARTVTWVAFAMAVYALVLVKIALGIPIAGFTHSDAFEGVKDASFNNVFGSGQRILIASIFAFLSGQFTDVAVFHVLKRASKNRFLWLRATGSTAVSQLIDTVVINVAAWYGTSTEPRLPAIIASSYVTKLVIAVALTPAIYMGHVLVERLLGMKPVRLDDAGEPIAEVAS
jgi:queuosine precursor transporter